MPVSRRRPSTSLASWTCRDHQRNWGRMPSLTTMNVSALIATIFAVVLTLVVLLRERHRKPRRSVVLLAGLLISGTGALLGQIFDMTGATHGVRLTEDTVSLLLVLAGFPCILVDITRRARA